MNDGKQDNFSSNDIEISLLQLKIGIKIRFTIYNVAFFILRSVLPMP